MYSPIVISPPPPNPVMALMMSSPSILWEMEQPKHPTMNANVDTKKHILRPNMSESRP
jgi:hypothetical protein